MTGPRAALLPSAQRRQARTPGLVAVLLAALVGGGAVAVAPAPASAAETELVLTATEATFASGAQPDVPQGGLGYLSATRTTDKTYVKFDTSAIPTGSTVTAASLELDVTSTSAQSGYLQVYAASSDWSAATLTDRNRPQETSEVQDTNTRAAVGPVSLPLRSAGSLVQRPTTSLQVRYSVSGARTRLAKTVQLKLSLSTSPAAGAPVPAPASTTDLPFTVAGPGTSAKKVFAHYFPPYPISLDNQPADSDYYTRNYLAPDGEGGKYAAVGGLLRDRPAGRSPLGGDWRLADLQTEVHQAAAAGIDGFTVDVLGTTGRNWDTTVRLMRAAETSGENFTVVPNLDTNGAGAAAAPDVVASKLAELFRSSAAYRLADGRYVLSSFKAEGRSPAWWSEVMGDLQGTYGMRVAFVAVLLNSSDTNMRAFAPISYALSNWGSRSALAARNGANNAAKAHDLGVRWMAPVAVQDERPAQGKYAEASNTETLRATWSRAIDDGADLVQMVTWNDYSETTSFAPSTHHGRSFLDISAYYATRFKSGATPRITGDGLYVTHRQQLSAATALLGGIAMLPNLGGSKTPPRDTVEVLTMLKAPARLRVSVGSSTQEVDAPAGLSTVLVPLRTGVVSASLTRDGAPLLTARSPFVVTATPLTLDYQYVAVSGQAG